MVFERFFRRSTSAEQIPKLRVVEADTKYVPFTVGHVMDRHGLKNGAGKNELFWVRDNQREARQLLRGDHSFFFPRAGDFQFVPSIKWHKKKLYLCWHWRSKAFRLEDRIVLID